MINNNNKIIQTIRIGIPHGFLMRKRSIPIYIRNLRTNTADGQTPTEECGMYKEEPEECKIPKMFDATL